MLAQAELNSLELKVDGGATHRFVLLLICEDDKLPPVLPNARGGQLSLSGTESRIFLSGTEGSFFYLQMIFQGRGGLGALFAAENQQEESMTFASPRKLRPKVL